MLIALTKKEKEMDFIKTPGTYSLRRAICAVSAACIWPTIQGLMK